MDRVSGIHEMDLEVNWKVQGFKSVEEYHHSLSCSTFIEKIKVPTIFYHSQDDPIVVSSAVEKTKSLKNENILMTSTNYGAHLCSHESFFDTN
jgi:predicted alpha/beta-fold hydrolase